MVGVTEERKTLRDYLLDGGAKGKYFASQKEPTFLGKPYGGYKVVDIVPERHTTELELMAL